MDYGEVLTKAWQITWKYKVLWIFGILAGCGSQVGGQGSNYSFGGGDGGGSPGGPGDFPLPPGMRQFFFAVENWFNNLSDLEIALFVGGIIIFILLMIIITLVLGTIGRIGLVRGALEGDRGAVSLTFGELFGQVRPFFWRVIGLGLLLALVGLVIVGAFAAMVAIFTIVTFGIGFFCLIPLFCLLVPVGWFVNIIIQQAYVAMLVDDLSIMEALSRGWEVTKNNVGPMILMGLILIIGVGIIGTLIVGAPLAFIVVPIIGGLIAGTDASVQTGILVSVLCFVAYLPVLIVLGGILRTYYESAWTLTYLRLTRPPQVIAMEGV
jgi:hypothetical protein